MSVSKSDIVAAKKQRDKKREEVSEELSKISLDTLTTAKDCLAYINLMLYKISIELGYYVFMQDVSRVEIPSKSVDECLDLIGKVLALQLEKATHPHIVLTRTEINDNYKFWSELAHGVMYRVTIKEYYCLRLLNEYFGLDTRWQTVFNTAAMHLAQSSVNFIDLKIYMGTEINETNRAMITKQINLSIELFEWAAKECEKSFVSSDNNYWITQAIKLLQALVNLYILINDSEKDNITQERIDRLEKRLDKTKKH